jgi:hypothetical protein
LLMTQDFMLILFFQWINAFKMNMTRYNII